MKKRTTNPMMKKTLMKKRKILTMKMMILKIHKAQNQPQMMKINCSPQKTQKIQKRQEKSCMKNYQSNRKPAHLQ